MFGTGIKQSKQSLALKPFVFKIQDGFLVGLATSSDVGSPCPGCVEHWLRQRDVSVQRATVSELTVRRDIIVDLLTENNPHVLYEVTNDGITTRLDSLIFPHPFCKCKKSNYVGLETWPKDINFAFSPITKIICARYGTPGGNIWVTSATGESTVSRQFVNASGIAKDREPSRFKAVEEWLKKAAILDLTLRIGRGETLTAESLQSGQLTSVGMTSGVHAPDGIGVGASREEAILDGLINLAKARTLRKYISHMKCPMLVVGTNNWIRGRVPFFLLQGYDLHILFYPNSTPAWVVGVAALSRIRTDERPIFVFSAGSEIMSTLDDALYRALAVCRPQEENSANFNLRSIQSSDNRTISKLNMWWTHWIYRCPKISLQDVLHLEPYPATTSAWRDYFRDGQEPVSIVTANHDLLPEKIRCLVGLTTPHEKESFNHNVEGIGTWATFRDALM